VVAVPPSANQRGGGRGGTGGSANAAVRRFQLGFSRRRFTGRQLPPRRRRRRTQRRRPWWTERQRSQPVGWWGSEPVGCRRWGIEGNIGQRPDRRGGRAGGHHRAASGAERAGGAGSPQPSAGFRYRRPSRVVVGVVVAVILVVVIGPVVGVVAGVVVAIVVAIGTWWGATPAVVRALRAELADEDEHARVFNQVEGLCASMGPRPPDRLRGDRRVARRPRSRSPTSRRRSVGHVGPGGVARPVQLEGVLAHELMHVKCADIVPATMAAAVRPSLCVVTPGNGQLRARPGRTRPRIPNRPTGRDHHPLPTGPAPGVGPDDRRARVAAFIAPGGTGVAHVTRWLWTVSLADAAGGRRSRAVSPAGWTTPLCVSPPWMSGRSGRKDRGAPAVD